MGWKDEQKDAVQLTIVLKFLCTVAAVAVEDEKCLTSTSFLFCDAIKYLFEPGKSDVVVQPPSRCIAEKNLVFSCLYVLYPGTAKSLLSREDNRRLQ
jgi:hypothetical protein